MCYDIFINEMEVILMSSKGFGYCGLACDYCQDNPHCIGCKKGGCPEKEACKNYQCCTSKNYKYCFECPDFPCEDSILHKLRIRTFCQYIQRYGEEDLKSIWKKIVKRELYIIIKISI